MKLEDFYARLLLSGLPVAYSHFTKAVKPPYLVYMQRGNSDFMADDGHYRHIVNVSVELYTSSKDLASETGVEEILDEADLPYSRVSEIYIDDEKLFQITWDLQLIS